MYVGGKQKRKNLECWKYENSRIFPENEKGREMKFVAFSFNMCRGWKESFMWLFCFSKRRHKYCVKNVLQNQNPPPGISKFFDSENWKLHR